MKKNILSVLAICAALLGCQKNEISETRPSGVELHATIEDDASTKTVMDESNNIRWSEGDQIIAFMKSSYGHKYKLISSFVGKTYADFEPATSAGGNLSAGTEWNHNVVYYPYSADVEAVKSGDNYTIDIALPTEQTYAPESFGNGFFPMVAVSENNNITFKNVLGGMKLQLRGTQKVMSIKLEGKNNEKLSGAAVVTAYADPELKHAITMESGASKSVILNCGSGVQLSESTTTEFIIALPPVLFSKGFTMIVIDDAGNEQTIETDKENSVLRSSLLVMPEVTLDKVPHTGDYIDEYGINHGPGVKIGETVWAPVNCGYHATDFKYGKLYQWGRKYGQGYDGDATTPTIEEGGVSAITGQHKSKSNVFFTGNDWLYPQDSKLWNSGTDSNPVKTENDPCPEGWRVPTYAELDELNNNYSSWTTDENGQSGYWFSGPNSSTASVPQVFFPAAGYRGYNGGNALNRGGIGNYWSSRPLSNLASYLGFSSSFVYMNSYGRAYGYSVRCVQESYSSVSEEKVEIVCAFPGGDTKAVGLDEFGNMYLEGDDFVDVNGVDYPVKGNETKTFAVTVPKADSYIVSYPANALNVNSDGMYSVNLPDEYVGSSLGVFVGAVVDESSLCGLESICGLVKIDLSAYEDWDRIEFKSNCGTAMWGDVVLSSDYSVSEFSDGKSSVTVTRSGDEQFVIVPVLPTSINGMSITVYKAGDILVERTSNKAITFKRMTITAVRI